MSETDPKIVDRRAFLRVASNLSCKLACLMPDGRLPGEGWADAEVIEIGGGGARIRTDLSVSADCVLSLRLVMPDTGRIVKVSGRVVQIMGDGPKREICVKFVGISEKIRASLIRHVFSEQIRQAKDQLSDRAGPETEQPDEDQSRN